MGKKNEEQLRKENAEIMQQIDLEGMFKQYNTTSTAPVTKAAQKTISKPVATVHKKVAAAAAKPADHTDIQQKVETEKHKSKLKKAQELIDTTSSKKKSVAQKKQVKSKSVAAPSKRDCPK